MVFYGVEWSKGCIYGFLIVHIADSYGHYYDSVMLAQWRVVTVVAPSEVLHSAFLILFAPSEVIQVVLP